MTTPPADPTAPAPAPEDLASLVGEWVTVTDPEARAVWQGQLVGLLKDPSLVLNLPGSGAICLPQTFTVKRTTPPAPDAPPHGQARAFRDLRDTGLLWLINRVAFHPRGLALALHADETGTAVGWSLHASAEHEPWTFDVATDSDGHTRAEATIAAAFTPEEV